MIKVLIIEDEQAAAKRLEKLLLEISPDFEISQHCDSIETSVSFLKNNYTPDLIMLDIQLGDGLSFEIFKQVEINCPVIFTTAFDEFAIKAFELNSIDYLLKPINRGKLEQSINKFRKLTQQSNHIDRNLLASLFDNINRNYKQRFLVSSGASLVSINTTDVAYFYSVERSTFLVNRQGKSYAVDFSLDKLEELVPSNEFFRVNRQFLISHNSIKKINIHSKSRIKLDLEPIATDEVLVSNARAHEFRTWLDK